MSAAFERFRYSFFEDTDSARQGLDTAALAEPEGEERARAEQMLIQCLPDARGVIGLGVLRSRRAEPALQALFENERRAQETSSLAADGHRSAYQLIYIAKALWLIRPDPRWLAAAIDILATAGDAIERQSAAEHCTTSAIRLSRMRS